MPATLKRGPGRPTLAVDGSDASKLLLKLPADLRTRAKAGAKFLGISEQKLIREAITKYLAEIQG